MNVTGETLAGVRLFQGLDAGARRAIAALCRGRHYAAGDQIVSHRDASRDVYFIVSGTVRVTIYSASGKEVTFRDQQPGETFGELSAIDERPRSAHVVALTDALVVSVSPANFWKILREHPAVTAVILKRLTALVRDLSDRVVEFSTLGVANRIHAELLRLARANLRGANEALISPAPTHASIASRVSTHREAVTRDLNRLRRTGIIERQGRDLRIPDVERLARMVQEVRGD